MLSKNRSVLYVSLTIFFVLCVICFFIFFSLKKSYFLKNNKQNEGLTVTFHSTQHICIKNILPMSDELGMKLDNKSVEYGGYGFVKFSIKNKNKGQSKYRIYIVKTDTNKNLIEDKYINFYLTDSDNVAIGNYVDNNVISYTDMYSLSSKPLGRLIYSGTLNGMEEKSLILRAWLSDEYILSDKDEFFDFDIFVDSE